MPEAVHFPPVLNAANFEGAAVFRVTTELHVCIAIASSFVLAKTELRFEVLQAGFYEHVLLLSFIVLVPGAFVVAVYFKVRHMNAAVHALEEKTENRLQERRRAFDLHVVGLGSAAEKKALQRYVEGCKCGTKSCLVRFYFSAAADVTLVRSGAVHGDHTCFISHFKAESAAEARILKLTMARALGVTDDQIFRAY